MNERWSSKWIKVLKSKLKTYVLRNKVNQSYKLLNQFVQSQEFAVLYTTMPRSKNNQSIMRYPCIATKKNSQVQSCSTSNATIRSILHIQHWSRYIFSGLHCESRSIPSQSQSKVFHNKNKLWIIHMINNDKIVTQVLKTWLEVVFKLIIPNVMEINTIKMFIVLGKLMVKHFVPKSIFTINQTFLTNSSRFNAKMWNLVY